MNKESQRKWKMENGNSKSKTRNMKLANGREKTDLTERRGVRWEEKSSHEEIENEEKEADQKKYRAAIDRTARKAAQ